METFGFDESADWVAYDVKAADGRQTFSVRHRDDYFGAFELPLLGAHNVRNALAAIAVAHCVGISATTVAHGLKTFAGVKRRLEIVGRAGGVTVYDDFAHHPTAVAETLARGAAGVSRTPRVGRVRASIGVVLPAGLPA